MIGRVRISVPWLGLVVAAWSSVASAQTPASCQATKVARTKAAHAEYLRESQECETDACRSESDARWLGKRRKINDETAACLNASRPKTAPAPYANWRPGDPSPVARDGRRYIMSCSGKPLGFYLPGSAAEKDLSARPGNCIPDK
jgi:hypothetical protein